MTRPGKAPLSLQIVAAVTAVLVPLGVVIIVYAWVQAVQDIREYPSDPVSFHLFGAAAFSLVGLVTLVVAGWQLRFLLRLVRALRNPVTIGVEGLTVAGIGPIPWSHLQSPRTEVTHDSEGDIVRTRVMPATAVGAPHLQSLPGHVRTRLTWEIGVIHIGPPEVNVRIPSVKGLRRRQVEDLIVEARARARTI